MNVCRTENITVSVGILNLYVQPPPLVGKLRNSSLGWIINDLITDRVCSHRRIGTARKNNKWLQNLAMVVCARDLSSVHGAAVRHTMWYINKVCSTVVIMLLEKFTHTTCRLYKQSRAYANFANRGHSITGLFIAKNRYSSQSRMLENNLVLKSVH